MDGWILTLFVLAAFAGGFVSGFSGFAMGLVVSGVWLHIITPMQTAALIAGYGLLTQGYGILKLRQALDWQNIWPLVAWHDDRHPDRRDPAELHQSGLSAVRRRRAAGALRDLRPGAAGVQADEDRRGSRHRHRHRQWPGRRTDRTRRRRLDDLLPMARLDAGMCNGRCFSRCCSRPLW